MAHYQNYIIPSQQLLQMVVLKIKTFFVIKGHFFDTRLSKKVQVRQNKSKSFPVNQPTRCNNFSSLLLDVYVQLNMFQVSSRPSSGAQQLQ
jgi:hypothetical protein